MLFCTDFLCVLFDDYKQAKENEAFISTSGFVKIHLNADNVFLTGWSIQFQY